MDISEILESTAFYFLCGIGYGAFAIMMIVLKRMGNGDLMPLWVKIVTIVLIPVIAAVWSLYAEG